MILQPMCTTMSGLREVLCLIFLRLVLFPSSYMIPGMTQAHLQLHLLVRILGSVVLPQHNLPLLLCARMLHPHLLRHLIRKIANEARIPEFRRDTQVFATSHQGIRFAAFGRSGNAIGVEVLLLATGDGDKSELFVSGNSLE